VHAGGWEIEGKGPARILTPRRSSGGSLRQQRSGEAAAATMTETRRQWRRRLGLQGREAAAAGLTGSRARGGFL
jgi:hypothetical protein